MTTTQGRPPTAGAGSAAELPTQDPVPAWVGALGTAAGQVFGALFRGVARVRGDRALHPRGATYAAQVVVAGGAGTGVRWLDEPSTSEATIRLSRSAGLPPWLPDVQGAALRVGAGTDEPVDLLFASSFSTGIGRAILRPRWRLDHAQLTTLWPVRSPAGPLVLRLVADRDAPTAGHVAGPTAGGDPVPRRFTLSWAVGRGPWHDAAEVGVGRRLPPRVDAERHDAVLHQLPGTSQYPVLGALREPSYRAARTVRARPE